MNLPTPESERVISLRPSSAADEKFLLKLYESTRSEEMALVPWDDEQRRAFVQMQFTAQQEHYRKYHPAATRDIILENNRPVGHLYVDRLDQEIKIVDFIVLPVERNSGIGSYLMSGILAEAAELGKRVGIYVETFNPSLRFFERLGFRETEQAGVHVYLEWSPGAP